MSQRITRRMTEERCTDGVLRLRMERETRWDEVAMLGEPVVQVFSRYMDGVETRVLTAGAQRTETVVTWEAVPARTQDVLDFGRLQAAATALTRQMAAYGPNNPPPPEQVASWLLAFGNLQAWRKEAEARFVGADGQIGTVSTLLRQFL